MVQRVDYSEKLILSAETRQYYTAQVPIYDIGRVKRQLRYQARRIGLGIHIEVNNQSGYISFICRKKETNG